MTLLRIANSGARGFYSLSGLQLSVLDLPFQARSSDLNRDQKIAHWEVNRLIRVRTSSGKRILPNRRYTLTTTDYLARGGDDLAWFMRRLPQNQIDWSSGALLRNAFMDYVAGIGVPLNQWLTQNRVNLNRLDRFSSKRDFYRASRQSSRNSN